MLETAAHTNSPRGVSLFEKKILKKKSRNAALNALLGRCDNRNEWIWLQGEISKQSAQVNTAVATPLYLPPSPGPPLPPIRGSTIRVMVH